MDSQAKYKLPITIAFAAIGIMGGLRRWKWLVDPIEDLALVWPAAMIKLLFGTEVLRWCVILTGLVFLGYSIWLLIN